MVKKINEDFFDCWTEESSYVLGFIWADGCLTRSKGALRVTFSSNDLELIEKINNAMGSEYAITEDRGNYKTGFSKPKMIKRLQDLGLIERKTANKEFPNIPSESISHFIRGYFDGNGYFTLENYNGDGKRLRSGFSTGSQVFALGLAKALHEWGLTHATVRYRAKRRSSYSYSYEIRYSKNDTKKLYELMYKDATIYLERKKKKYEDNPEGHVRVA